MAPTAKIVAAIDLSEVSQAVVKAAERFAKKLGCGVRVLYVVEPMDEDDDGGLLLPVLRKMAEETRAELEKEFADFISGLPEPADVEREAVLAHGRAYSEILHHARSVEAPLVVIGAPRPSALSATTYGRLLRRSPVPVLLVRRGAGQGYRNVGVAVDFSQPSLGALSLAGRLAEPDAGFSLINVIPTLSKARLLESLGKSIDVRANELKKIADAHIPGRKVAMETLTGIARSELVEWAKKSHADLVAVGVSATSDIANIFLGSVAESVSKNAPCDVLVYASGRKDSSRP